MGHYLFWKELDLQGSKRSQKSSDNTLIGNHSTKEEWKAQATACNLELTFFLPLGKAKEEIKNIIYWAPARHFHVQKYLI